MLAALGVLVQPNLTLKGTYSTTAADSKDEVFTLSWDTDLDLRVFDQIKK